MTCHKTNTFSDCLDKSCDILKFQVQNMINFEHKKMTLLTIGKFQSPKSKKVR